MTEQIFSGWWWMSFADGPPPDGFLGVALVQGNTFEKAVEKAWRKGCNPGGEINAFPLAVVPPRKLRHRLLNRAEATDLQDKIEVYEGTMPA